MTDSAAEKPMFLNVDLEITSAAKLDSLADEMGDRVMVLYLGPAAKRKHHLLAVEISSYRRNPDAVIHSLCGIIESLCLKSRKTWNKAKKEFDIGFELRPSERLSRFTLRPDTINRVAKLGANLTVTYYRRDTDDRGDVVRKKPTKSSN